MKGKLLFIAIAASIVMSGCAIKQQKIGSVLPSNSNVSIQEISASDLIALEEYRSMTNSSLIESKHIPSGLLTLKSENDKSIIKPSKHYTEITPNGLLDSISTSANNFSFSANSIDVKTALAMFATQYNLNIIPDNEVKGKITVSFHDANLSNALEAILSTGKYYAKASGNMIYVKNTEDAVFQINYPRSTRTGDGSVNASMSSSSGGSSGGSSSGSSSGSSGGSSSGSSGGSSSGSSSGMYITSNDSINFLDELNDEIENLLTKDFGTVTINKLSGTIHVKDKHAVVNSIREYLNVVDESIHRQVVIVASILEVSSNDNDSLGVDWTAIGNKLSKLNLSTATSIVNPLGGIALLPAVTANVGTINGKVNAVIAALREQGTIEVISRPHLRTMNNQPALIKVGTDRTFFRTETLISNTTAGTTTTTNDIPEKVTVGLVMSITPQISKNGDVIIDISPVITSLSSVDTSINGSTAPRLDIRQISSLVKVKSGEPIIIGGLINKTSIDQIRGVPILSDLNFIGGLFKTKQKTRSTKELVIFITPYVIN